MRSKKTRQTAIWIVDSKSQSWEDYLALRTIASSKQRGNPGAFGWAHAYLDLSPAKKKTTKARRNRVFF